MYDTGLSGMYRASVNGDAANLLVPMLTVLISGIYLPHRIVGSARDYCHFISAPDKCLTDIRKSERLGTIMLTDHKYVHF